MSSKRASGVTAKEIAKFLGVEPEKVTIERDGRVSVDISDRVEPVSFQFIETESEDGE